MTPEKLSQLLKLYYNKNYESAIYHNHEGNRDFAEDLAKFLIKNGVKNFEFGDYMGNEENYPEFFSNHSFIKYQGLIFNSFLFGEEIEDGESYISETNWYEGFSNNYFEYTKPEYILTLKDFSSYLGEEWEKINNDLEIYGFEFLKEVYQIEYNYSLLKDEHFDKENINDILHEDKGVLKSLNNLKQIHLDYLKENEIIKKNNKVWIAYAKDYSSKPNLKDLLDIKLFKNIEKNIERENLILFKQKNQKDNLKNEEINFGF